MISSSTMKVMCIVSMPPPSNWLPHLTSSNIALLFAICGRPWQRGSYKSNGPFQTSGPPRPNNGHNRDNKRLQNSTGHFNLGPTPLSAQMSIL